ncbi:MAG: homocysteine S-methyltransferase family protein [Gemmataceae bacterium]|nr:homocysteine S-methyltransferase family protein [Gemmataceae bacterium]
MKHAWFEGPLGTELIRRGARADSFLPEWNESHPEIVDAVHAAYASAGADLFLANSFTLNPPELARRGMTANGPRWGTAAVALAEKHGVTLGDLGPISRSADFPNEGDLRTAVEWLGDADGILLETLSDVTAFDAVRWIRRERTDWPIYVSFAFRRDADGDLRTYRGLDPATIAELANDAGLAALGVNCGLDLSMADVASIVAQFRERTTLPLIARPNAGTPYQVGGTWTWPLDADAFARNFRSLIDAGATLLGGCCGTTPEHLLAMRAAAEDLLLS